MNHKTPQHFVGVDLSAPKVLAGVFNPELQFRGKAKFSAKPERGPHVVADRIARCIRDAVDECDLHPRDIRAIGVAVPGEVDPAEGVVISAPGLGRADFPLCAELEKRLGARVVLDNDGRVAALGIYAQEFPARPRTFIAIFPEKPGNIGVIVEGEFATEIPRRTGLPLRQFTFPMRGQAIRNPAKQLRKAVQAGDEAARKLVRDLATETAVFAANVINLMNPDVVSLGGGMAEELRDWILPVVLKHVQQECPAAERVQIVVSGLGKNAGIVGGAVLATRGTPLGVGA